MINSIGCDSILTLDLTINNSVSVSNFFEICNGSSVTVGNNTYTNSGVYTDYFTAINGCDSVINTEVFVEQLDVVISQSANSLIANSLGGTAPYNYSWSNGQAGQSITVSENGIYWVIVEDFNQCVSDTIFFTVDWISTNISQIDLENLLLYPNPTNGKVNIEFNSYTSEDVSYSVINLIGEKVFEGNFSSVVGNNILTIDISQFPNAIYTLKLISSNTTINKQIILER